MRLRISFLLCCLVLCCAVFGQRKRAQHFYNAAQRSWSYREKYDAYGKMQKAIKKDPKSPVAYGQLGEWYFLQHKFQEAASVYRDASAKCKNGGKLFAKPFAKSLVYSGMPDSALIIIEQYTNAKDLRYWSKLKEQARFVKQAYVRMNGNHPSNLGKRINSGYAELFPSMTVDTTTLYFTRRVKNMDEDFFVAHADTCGEWLRADNMGSLPNTESNESAQFISADGHYLFFSRSDNRSENGWAEGGYDLYTAYRVRVDTEEWTTPQPFGGTINTPAYEGMPSLSPDNRQLYFVSDRPGGYGGLDIWISKFENNLWQVPVNAGPKINTDGNETAPFIALDNKTIFFTSDGHPGMGGTDIFMSRRVNDSTFEEAQNLGYPINSACNEQSEWVVGGGHRMIYSSDREGPTGNYDLFETTLPDQLQPAVISFLKGKIYDSISRQGLSFAVIYIVNADRGDTIYQFQSNRGDASYLVPLSMNTRYAMHVNRIGYTDVSDTFTIDKRYLKEPMVHNVAMLPYDYLAPINDSLIAMVHFDINKVELTDSDNVLIGKAIEPFLLDKSIMVYVNGYTDNTGTPMINEELSTKRAYMVAKALTNLGIEELSVIAKGWGEANTIASNETEEGQKRNRRVEIIIRR